MFTQFIEDLIDKDSFKVLISEEAMNKLAQEKDVYCVHSSILYRLYVLYIDDITKPEERPAFYRKAGVYLYYERFSCVHGDEFYYYIKFNVNSTFYQEHQTLLKNMIIANDPSILVDYIGTKNLSDYNKQLKETL